VTPNFFLGKLGWLSSKEELIFDTRKDRKLRGDFKATKRRTKFLDHLAPEIFQSPTS
jgi:hypothetical protein